MPIIWMDDDEQPRAVTVQDVLRLLVAVAGVIAMVIGAAAGDTSQVILIAIVVLLYFQVSR
jgi:hypothetical protein